MAFIRGEDAINGTEGTLQITINGRVETLARVLSFEANVDLNKSEFQPIGDQWTRHKVNGRSGSGSMTLLYGTPLFIELLRSGTMPAIRLIATNDDRASRSGRQTIALEDVSFDNLPISRLESGDHVEVDADFTFSGITALENFRQ